ncbi:MAG: hypothetical protein PHE89_05840 [Alphaproteobacteria bacterium]|nr:hypothetical protein [Alphaproteobacteria bacterium]
MKFKTLLLSSVFFMACKVLVNLIINVDRLFKVSKNDEKRELMKILFSKLEFDGKNVVFSKRKPIEKLLSMGLCPLWLCAKEICSNASQKPIAITGKIQGISPCLAV